MATRSTQNAEMAEDAADKLHLTPSLPDTSESRLPFETQELRDQLERFLQHRWLHPYLGEGLAIGNYRWGIYAFYDYDREPIYVGQASHGSADQDSCG